MIRSQAAGRLQSKQYHTQMNSISTQRLELHAVTERVKEELILQQIITFIITTTMKMLTVSILLCAMLALTRAIEGDGPGPTQYVLDTWDMFTTVPIIPEEFAWEPSCPDGWANVGYRCLLYIPEKMTWTKAEQNCQSHNGNLASVFEYEQFIEIREVMQKAGYKSAQVWVGGSKAPGDSSWSWSDGMLPTRFPIMCSEEPPKQNCLKIAFKGNASGCLKDKRCEAKLPSVCSTFIM